MFDTDIHHLIKDTGFFLVLLEVSELEEIDVREFVPLLIMDAMHMMQVNVRTGGTRAAAASTRSRARRGTPLARGRPPYAPGPCRASSSCTPSCSRASSRRRRSGASTGCRSTRAARSTSSCCSCTSSTSRSVVDVRQGVLRPAAAFRDFPSSPAQRTTAPASARQEMHHENIEREEKKKDAQAEANAARALGRTSAIIRRGPRVDGRRRERGQRPSRCSSRRRACGSSSSR